MLRSKTCIPFLSCQVGTPYSKTKSLECPTSAVRTGSFVEFIFRENPNSFFVLLSKNCITVRDYCAL